MESISSENVVCVLTARGIERILAEGGSQAWVLDAKRAKACEYVVCIQNRGFTDDWGDVSAPHHTAFIIGRLKDVVRSTEDGSGNRWRLVFSEYAEIDIADAWPGYRNPVFYTNPESIGVDISALNFQPMPELEPPVGVTAGKAGPLTIAEAKEGLALAFGVAASDIEITIRG